MPLCHKNPMSINIISAKRWSRNEASEKSEKNFLGIFRDLELKLQLLYLIAFSIPCFFKNKSKNLRSQKFSYSSNSHMKWMLQKYPSCWYPVHWHPTGGHELQLEKMPQKLLLVKLVAIVHIHPRWIWSAKINLNCLHAFWMKKSCNFAVDPILFYFENYWKYSARRPL